MRGNRVLLAVVAILVPLAVPAFAQDGGEEEYDMEAALKEVTRLLTEAESLLVKALKPGGSAAEAAEAGEAAKEKIDALLRQGGEDGQKAVDKMTEILENAPQQQGQGEGQEQQQPDSEEEKRRREQERQMQERDPKNSADGQQPKDGQKKEGEPDPATQKPPDSGRENPSEPDPNADWLANLPEKVRQAYLNGEWEVIPPKWRELIEAYTKKVAESDR